MDEKPETKPMGQVIQIDEARIRDHLGEMVRGTVEAALNAMLDAEADQLCSAGRYERSEGRKDTRAGHYERALETGAGQVSLKVPKLRRQTFETAIIERYRRRESSVEEALIEMYLAGVWENGVLRREGRVEMTRTALEGFGRRLEKSDEVVIEATGNCMAVSRVLSPHVARVVIANPLQVKAISHAHVKTDKVDAGTLASLYAAGYLPEIRTPDADTERQRRLTARRYQVVRHRTRLKNEVHAILHAHLIPKCPHADLFNRCGREWLASQPLPEDERAAIERHVRELDRLGEDLAELDRDIAESALEDAAINRLLTITGVNLTVAAGLMAAIGDIARFDSPQKLVSYFGLNPRVRQSGLGPAHHGRISKVGRSHARAMLVEAAWAAAKAPGPLRAFFIRIRAQRGHQIAAVAVARKLAVLCWHMLTKGQDYLWARPSLVAHKRRAMELQAGRPQKKGSARGPAYTYNVKTLRTREARVAEQAEKEYEHFVAAWRPRPPKRRIPPQAERGS